MTDNSEKQRQSGRMRQQDLTTRTLFLDLCLCFDRFRRCHDRVILRLRSLPIRTKSEPANHRNYFTTQETDVSQRNVPLTKHVNQRHTHLLRFYLFRRAFLSVRSAAA